MKSSSPLPAGSRPITSLAVTISELSDPTSVGQSIEILQQDVVKLTSQPLRGKRVLVRLGECFVLFHSTNLSVRVRACLQTGFVAYTVFARHSAGTINGIPVDPGRILASACGIEVELIVAAGYESIAFLLPRGMIQDHMMRRHRDGDVRIPTGIELLSQCSEGAQELYDWGSRLIEIACKQPDVFDIPEAQAAAQVDLIEKLIATLGAAMQVMPSKHELTQQQHSQIVQRVEDFALAHASEQTYVTDLCEAAGVSERTLQYAFRELLGMTPTAYLSRLRLHRVRQALQAASNSSTTVTKEALRWGFWHFGDFSRAYKECFGELPSDTLRGNGEPQV